ncbi:hypothetical protein D3C84_958480 [compost metagenome]
MAPVLKSAWKLLSTANWLMSSLTMPDSRLTLPSSSTVFMVATFTAWNSRSLLV